jgi:hypothetical protein
MLESLLVSIISILKHSHTMECHSFSLIPFSPIWLKFSAFDSISKSFLVLLEIVVASASVREKCVITRVLLDGVAEMLGSCDEIFGFEGSKSKFFLS